MTTGAALAAIACAVGLSVPAGPAVAQAPVTGAGASCQGRTATLVGEPSGTVTGTTGADVIVTNGARSVSARAGADLVCITGPRESGAAFDGGPGSDTVVVVAPDEFVRADLRGDLQYGAEDPVVATLARFENAVVRAHSVQLSGDNDPNRLAWNGCVGTMTARRGNDRVVWARGDNLCAPSEERIIGVFGGRGTDRLVGSPWSDTLVGGRGTDTAYGRAGVDRCRTEIRHGCELR